MTTTDTKQAESQSGQEVHRAGAFDIRTFIALLIGVYGAVLVPTGLFATSDADLARAGGLNINVLAGVGMLVVAAAFLAWARLRPVVVPEQEPDDRA